MLTVQIEKLLDKLPCSWHGLIWQLSDQENPLSRATYWLREQTHWQRPDVLSWHQLFAALTEQEPVVQKETIVFKPRLWVFPLLMQRHLLSFLNLHQLCIPPLLVEDIIPRLQLSAPDDHWIRFLLHMIHCDSHSSLQPACWADVCNLPPLTEKGNMAADHCLMYLSSTVHESRCWGPWHSQPGSTMDVSVCDNQSRPLTGTDSPLPSYNIETTLSGSYPPGDSLSVVSQIALPEDSQRDKSQLNLTDTALRISASDILPDEIKTDFVELAELWQTAVTCSPPKQLSVVLTLAPQQIMAACEYLHLSDLTEVGLAVTCSHLETLVDSLSHANTLCFIRQCFLPKVLGLERSASRLLQTILCSLTKTFPSPVLEALFTPTIQQEMSLVQAELLIKIVKDSLSPQHCVHVVSALCDEEVTWRDAHLLLLQNCLTIQGLKATPEALKSLACALDRNATSQAKNAKFGKLLHVVLTKHGSQMQESSWCQVLAAVSCHNSFLSKSIKAILAKVRGSV